jgi:hypothetical protein
MKAKYPKFAELGDEKAINVYNEAITNSDKTKPLVGQIDTYLDNKY